MFLPTIHQECAQFLKESNGLPLLKNLKCSGEGFRKVKVRKKDKNDLIVEIFDQSFPEYKNIFKRALFVNGSLLNGQKNEEPFYIFPPDGYQFLYNPVIIDTREQYNKELNRLTQKISKKAALDIFSNSIRHSYLSESLEKGIKSGCEILIYRVQYFYAIRKNLVDNYQSLM